MREIICVYVLFGILIRQDLNKKTSFVLVICKLGMYISYKYSSILLLYLGPISQIELIPDLDLNLRFWS